MQDAIISFPFLGLVLDPPRFITIFGFNIYFYGMILGTGVLVAAILRLPSKF